jgi:hypothetical protein
VLVRWSAWIALLVAEVLVLSVRFDTGMLQGNQRWWAELLGHSAEALRLGSAAAAATLLVGAARWRGAMRRWSGPRNPPRRRWPLLLGHLAAFAGFFRLTAMILGPEVRSSSHPDGWIAAWAALGLATLASWAAVMIPLPLKWGGLCL